MGAFKINNRRGICNRTREIKMIGNIIKNIKLPTAEEIKNMKPALDAAQLEKLFGN